MQKTAHQLKQNGFTIVELLIVVVVIAILAAIVIVSYNGISRRAEVVSIHSDLISTSKAAETSKVIAGTDYNPSVLDEYLSKRLNNAVIEYQYGNRQFACFNATGIKNSTLQYHIETTEGISTVKDGHCPTIFTTSTSRCLGGQLYISATARNNLSETLIITASNPIFGNNTDTVAPGGIYAVSHHATPTSTNKGITTITLQGIGGSTYSEVRYHHYDEQSC